MYQSLSTATELGGARLGLSHSSEVRRDSCHAEVTWKQVTYLTTDELAARIKYDARTIRERLKDSVLFEGVHYIRPFGGRKILYLWERIEEDMGVSTAQSFTIPMANGGVCHG